MERGPPLLPCRVLAKEFYQRSVEIVAQDLLGKVLARRLKDGYLKGVIVETEAYYGTKDPASRAHRGMRSYNSLMWGEVGVAFIYNVHNNWMFNIVAHKPEGIGAVLIRAMEPIEGVETMKKNRGTEDIRKIASGPGRLSKALKIDKSLNGTLVTAGESGLLICDNVVSFETAKSHRIGVKRDLAEELRFYMKGNKFVSR